MILGSFWVNIWTIHLNSASILKEYRYSGVRVLQDIAASDHFVVDIELIGPRDYFSLKLDPLVEF